MVIGRWLLRAILVVAMFFLGTFAAGLLLQLLTWDQSLVDIFSISAGIALAVFTFVQSARITDSRGGRTGADTP